MNCAKCDAKNEEYARYCWNCGTPTHIPKIRNKNLLRFLNSEWMGLTQALPKLLYIGALCVLGIFLFRAIYILIEFGTSVSDLLMAVSMVASGLFIVGILVGLAGIASNQIDNVQKQMLRRFLYITAVCLLIIAITVLAFSMFYDVDSLDFSIAMRLYSALPAFAYIGLFASGLLVSLGALNTPRGEIELQEYDPTINILYSAAVATIIIGIITAILSVTTKGEPYSNLSKASSFLSNLAYDGIFLGGTLAALGKFIALRNRARNTSDSANEECEENEEDATMDGPTTP